MRALSLWQPWATAIALGIKRIETRHWSTSYRGPLAIHAAKHWDREQREFASIEHALGRLPGRIPFGAIVAFCELVAVRGTDELIYTQRVGAIERIYGNYDSGRFGWVLENIRALDEPIPFKGAQGLFTVPDGLLGGRSMTTGEQGKSATSRRAARACKECRSAPRLYSEGLY